jgi:hypothetical protein
MKGNEAYVQELADALDKKIAKLESEGLVQLKDHFKIIYSAFQGIRNIMLKKGVIHDDPYRFDTRISEVTTPPESSFPESERTEQLSTRVSQYDGQLEFLINYYQFSFEFLNMDRIRRLISLTRYFNFTQLTVNSANINTRVLAEYLDTIRKGSDSLSVGVINDGLMHLEKSSKAIMQILKDVTTCHKESWKLALRRDILSLMDLEREKVVSHQDDCMKAIRKKFAEVKPERSFYGELVQEVLAEDFSQESETLRRAVIRELIVREEKKKDVKQEINFRLMLLEGVRIVSSVYLQLDDAVQKLEENMIILESERNTFWMKVKKAFRALFVRNSKDIFVELDFTDPITTAQRTESVNFNQFLEDVRKRSKLYASLNARTGTPWQRMESITEDGVYAFLEKNLEELQVLHRRLQALDLFFRSEVDKESRSRLHGIKLETETVKNTVIRANQKKHEYVSQKEELEQMRKLGIKAEALP